MCQNCAKLIDNEEADIRARLAHWFESTPKRPNYFVYEEFDRRLNLPPGSTKKHLRPIALKRQYDIEEDGEISLKIKRRPRQPNPQSWMRRRR